MFKKTQQYLLLNYPLIWNLKLVPIAIITLLFNLLFFILGYTITSIDIEELSRYNYYSSNFQYYFYTALTSILVLIVWLVYYFRNNAFKAFYPKTSFSLYKEWLLIFTLLISNCLYTVSFMLGAEYKVRGIVKELFLNKIDELLPYFEVTSTDFLVAIYMALALSALLFSFRVTSGKSWLAALVTAGLLFFVLGMIVIIIDKRGTPSFLFPFFWTVILVRIGVYILLRIKNNQPKGRKSEVMINLIFWISPFILLVSFEEYVRKFH